MDIIAQNYLLNVSLLFLAVGIYLAIFPPKKINYFIGYRTRKSMYSQEAWDFAQVFSGRGLIISSVIMILISLLGFVFEITGVLKIVFNIMPVIAAGAVLVLTEVRIDEHFISKRE